MKKTGQSRIFELMSLPGNTISSFTLKMSQQNSLPNCPLLTPNILLHIGQDVLNAALDIIVNEPCHTPTLSGKVYVDELISPETHPDWIQE